MNNKKRMFGLLLFFILCLTPVFNYSNISAGTDALALENNMAKITGQAFEGGLIIDHTHVALFDQIPDEWVERVKQKTFHYAHRSHGGQIITGLYMLESMDPKYSFARIQSASSAQLPPIEDPPAFRMFDGNPPSTYVLPAEYWYGSTGVNNTRAVADTGDYLYSMWSWCGEMEYYSIWRIDIYNDTLDMLGAEYPDMEFIYMTGHSASSPGYQAAVARNNAIIRDFVVVNNKVLFDFEAIEKYDPDGNYYPDTSDECEWTIDWCADHPEDCDYGNYQCNRTGNVEDTCSHSVNCFNCLRKAKAFWVMMAILEGWDPDGPVFHFGDHDQDGDVDGSDLAIFMATGFDQEAIAKIAGTFGLRA